MDQLCISVISLVFIIFFLNCLHTNYAILETVIRKILSPVDSQLEAQSSRLMYTICFAAPKFFDFASAPGRSSVFFYAFNIHFSIVFCRPATSPTYRSTVDSGRVGLKFIFSFVTAIWFGTLAAPAGCR